MFLRLRHFACLSVVYLSFLAMLFVCTWWVRSYRVGDVFAVAKIWRPDLSATRCDVATGSGVVMLSLSRAHYSAPDRDAQDALVQRSGVSWAVQGPRDLPNMDWQKTPLRKMGFLFLIRRFGTPSSGLLSSWVALPFWCPALLLGVVPASWGWKRLIRYRRRTAGRCVSCGYDVRATPLRCPECGRVPQLPGSGARRPVVRAALVGLPIATAVAFSLFHPLEDLSADQPAELVHQDGARGVPAASRPLSQSEAKGSRTMQQEATALARAWQKDAYGVPRWARETAARMDPTQTYVFFHMSDPKWMLKNHIASLKVVARQNGQWHDNVVFVRVGDKVGTPGFPSDVRLDELRVIDGKLSITLVDLYGKKRTHVAEVDEKTPEFSLLTALCTYGRAWDRSLFGE